MWEVRTHTCIRDEWLNDCRYLDRDVYFYWYWNWENHSMFQEYEKS